MTNVVQATLILCLCATMMLLSASCRTSMVSKHWGRAFDANVTQMTADLGASQREAGPTGLDPHTGAKVAEGYYESQNREIDSKSVAPSIIQIDTK